MSVPRHVTHDQWFAGLPTFPAHVSALITDTDGAVLIVKPNYRPYWGMPGGALEPAEAPHECCARGVAAVLGITIAPGRLLVVDWVPPTATRMGWFGFVFDGGVLPGASSIHMKHHELDAFAFVDESEVATRLARHTAARVAAALRVRAGEPAAYLCAGQPVAGQ